MAEIQVEQRGAVALFIAWTSALRNIGGVGSVYAHPRRMEGARTQMTPSIFGKVKRRLERAFAGEEVGPTSNITYEDLRPLGLDPESRAVADQCHRMGYEIGKRRGAQDARERAATVADDFFAQDSSKRKWGLAIGRAIRRDE